MGTGKKKIEIKRREKEEQRMVTFSKRRKGLFKKAHELHCLTGADIAVLAFSPAGRPYTTGAPSFESAIDKYFNIKGKEINVDGTPGGDECDKIDKMKSWLEGTKVEAYESVDDLVLLKNVVEEIRDKILRQLMDTEEDFVLSLFA